MLDEDGEARTPEERLYRIVEEGLCIGCGLCQSVAGAERVRMVVTPAGDERPYVTGPLDHATVDRIYDVCPGTRIDGLPEREIVEETTVDPVWGPTLRIVLAHAGDPEVRFKASTGGVLTALGAYLIESGRVDFVLHAKASERQPSFGERHVSRSRAEVLEGMGSRYGPTAPLVDLDEALAEGKPFAYVGKPCDVSALRNYARHDPRFDELCRYKLTLVCGGFMPTPDLRAFLAEFGIDYREVAGLRYRGYGCPGPTRIELRDGTVIEKNYLEFWGEDDSAWSLPFRCKVCPDGIGEASDLSAADAWPGGAPTWEGQAGDPGTNAVLARTRAGLELLEAAARDGALVIEGDVSARFMDGVQPHQVSKKRAVWARYLGLRTAGRLAPEVRRLRIAELAFDNGVSENLRQARGTRRRARAGKTGEPTPRPA